jgi:transcriptional regulator with XRE-family HTH domain
MKRTIGEQVAQYMEDHGLKAAAMARLCGTSRQNIEGLIKRDRFPRDYIDRLAAAMEMTVDGLLAGEYVKQSSTDEIDGDASMSKDTVQANVNAEGCQDSPEMVSGDMGENESALCQPIPTSMTYSAPNLKSCILLMGSLVGALDRRSRRLIGELLKDLAEEPDDAEDIANKASGLATIQKTISKNKELNKAMRSRERDVETKPAPLEH